MNTVEYYMNKYNEKYYSDAVDADGEALAGFYLFTHYCVQDALSAFNNSLVPYEEMTEPEKQAKEILERFVRFTDKFSEYDLIDIAIKFGLKVE